MTYQTTDTSDLGSRFFESVRAASDAYEASGTIPSTEMDAVLVFSAAVAASHEMAKVKRMNLIIEALEELADILDGRPADDRSRHPHRQR